MSKSTSIKDKFQEDKKSTLAQITDFLKANKDPKPIEQTDLDSYRKEANEFVKNGDFTKAMQTLEKLRDAKTGVVLHEVEKDGVPVLVRDARNAKEPQVRSTEAFEMQYLNAIRAGMDLAEGKPELKQKLQEQAAKFMDDFSKNNSDKSQEELAGLLKSEIKGIGKLMEDNGVANAYQKLNIAKDFQNFNDKHANIATISTVKNGDKEHTVVETEVAMKGLTDKQKGQYEKIANDGEPKPDWYKAMPKWEQDLCKKYAPAILDGTHVIPTQLRQVAGMKNAFEKITSIFEKESLETLHTSKHAGTIASLSRDKNARQGISDDNAQQGQEWVGKDKTLHCNTFNSAGLVGAGDDPEIVKRTQTAMKNVGGKETNTSFNAARYSGSASDLGGVKDTLNKLADALPEMDKATATKDEVKALKAIKAHIKPRGWFSRTFGLGKPSMSLEKAIEKLGDKVDPQAADIYKSAAGLKKSVEQASAILRFGDGENVSLQTSTKLNQLTQKIEAIPETIKGLDLKKIPKEEILNMCASGKDRTGLAEHDQSAQAIAQKLGMNVKDVDGQLLKSGHTAQQAGGIYAGGATVGCMGTKSENKAGIPKSRKKALTTIVEVTAGSNKIKGKSKLTKEPKQEKVSPKQEKVSPKQEQLSPKQEQVSKVNSKEIPRSSSLKPSPTPKDALPQKNRGQSIS